jgi:hypothetical protein
MWQAFVAAVLTAVLVLLFWSLQARALPRQTVMAPSGWHAAAEAMATPKKKKRPKPYRPSRIVGPIGGWQ